MLKLHRLWLRFYYWQQKGQTSIFRESSISSMPREQFSRIGIQFVKDFSFSMEDIGENPDEIDSNASDCRATTTMDEQELFVLVPIPACLSRMFNIRPSSHLNKITEL